MVKLTYLDWRAVSPVYTVAVERQRAATELIPTEEMALTAMSRMFSNCSYVFMDTVCTTVRSNTYSTLASTLIITELKTKIILSIPSLKIIILCPKSSLYDSTNDGGLWYPHCIF